MSVEHAKLTDSIVIRHDQRNAAHAFVADVSRSLDFYRELGCEVRLAADGWVQLWRGDTLLVLEHAESCVPTAPVPLVRLTSDDLHALRKRLLARGISTRIAHTRGLPAREFEVVDPDGHQVVVSELPRRI